ncbi:MAG: SirB2 family protein [Burkholderiaceae bacterium]
MLEFYPQIKHTHIALALASGLLFALRGAAVLAGMRWPMTTAIRVTSYAIDTALLTAALMLLSILPGAMYANGWLTVKLCLLVVYIVLGVFALRRAQRPGARALCYAGALLVFVMIYGIARTHHPFGYLRGLFG